VAVVEVVWTEMAQRHVQRIFADNESRRAESGILFLAHLEKEIARIRLFPESAPVWKPPIRRLLFQRRLGVFYVVHGVRLVIHGLFPLSMNPTAILRRIEQADWP